MASVDTPGARRLRVVPLFADRVSDRVPIALGHRVAHRRRRVANPFEAVEHAAVAVDVPLHDVPVVRPGVARFARVAQHETALQFRGVHVQRDAADAVDVELERGDAAIERRAVVLQSGGHPNRLRLDIHRDLQQRLRLVVRAVPLRQRRADGDVQRRGAGNARAGGGLGRGRQRDPARFEEVDEERQEAQLAAIPQLAPVVRFDRDARVFGVDDDAGVGAGLERRAGPEADGGVDRLRAGVKQVERPDVQRAAREIDAGGRGGLDSHLGIIEPCQFCVRLRRTIRVVKSRVPCARLRYGPHVVSGFSRTGLHVRTEHEPRHEPNPEPRSVNADS